MIQGFADQTTEQIWKGMPKRRINSDLQRQALKRLGYLNLAKKIEDLYIPPSNKFHRLEGTGRFAISVNSQWRITFLWTDAGPADVKFEDYH
jgi:proteic killer suppression protein